MKLRYYQEQATDAALDCSGNALIVLPGGSGKSLVVAGIIKKTLSIVPEANIIVLHPRKELIEQNFAKFQALCPEHLLNSGIYSESVGLKETGKQITFGGIQSIHKKHHLFPITHVLVVDECHLIKAEEDGMFWGFINDLRTRNSNLHIIGLTATPFRTDSGLIMDAGKKKAQVLFPDISYEVPMMDLVRRGFLAPLVGKFGGVQPDLSKVHIVRGEYAVEDLENVLNPITEAALDEMCELGRDRKHWLVFCPSVKHAETVTLSLLARGIKTAAIYGSLSTSRREDILNQYSTGALQALVNCEILTTGWDFPRLDLISIFRATKSAGLFVQMCVRGSRIAEGKTNCMILDYGRNLERFGSVDNIRVKKFKLGYVLDKQPLKKCPKCGNALAINIRNCECGYIFEKIVANHEAIASEREIMASKRWVTVTKVDFQIGRKEPKPAHLKVIYQCITGEVVREAICFEHEDFPRRTACAWWRYCVGQESKIPANAIEGYDRQKEIKPIGRLLIEPDKKNKSFWKILRREIGVPKVEEAVNADRQAVDKILSEDKSLDELSINI